MRGHGLVREDSEDSAGLLGADAVTADVTEPAFRFFEVEAAGAGAGSEARN